MFSKRKIVQNNIIQKQIFNNSVQTYRNYIQQQQLQRKYQKQIRQNRQRQNRGVSNHIKNGYSHRDNYNNNNYYSSYHVNSNVNLKRSVNLSQQRRSYQNNNNVSSINLMKSNTNNKIITNIQNNNPNNTFKQQSQRQQQQQQSSFYLSNTKKNKYSSRTLRHTKNQNTNLLASTRNINHNKILQDYLLQTKCLLKQLKQQLQINFLQKTTFINMFQEIIKIYKKCNSKQRQDVIFQILEVFPKIYFMNNTWTKQQHKRAQEIVQLCEQCFRFLNSVERIIDDKNKNQKIITKQIKQKRQKRQKLQDLIFIDRIDLSLIYLFENYNEKYTQWIGKYPKSIENLLIFQDKVFFKVVKKEGEQILNNFMMLKHQISKETLPTSEKMKNFKRNVMRKKTSIMDIFQSYNGDDRSSQRNGSRSSNKFNNIRQSGVSKSSDPRGVRKSIRPSLLARNSVFMNKKISTRWGPQKQFYRKPSATSSQQSFKKIEEDFITDNDVKVQQNSSSQSSFLQQKIILRQLFKQQNRKNLIQTQKAVHRQFYMFCEVNRILRVFIVYDIQISKMLGSYKINFNIKGFFRDKIQFRVDLSKFKLFSPQHLTVDQYRMVIANSIQIQKHFTKFTVNNNSIMNKFNQHNPHKSIIKVKDNNTMKEHFGIYRKINAYFFERYQIPINHMKQQDIVRKFIYDTSLSQLYEVQQLKDFKEKQLANVVQQDQNRLSSEIQGNSYYIESMEHHLKGKTQNAHKCTDILQIYSLYQKNILKKKTKIKTKYPCIYKTLKTQKGFKIIKQTVSDINSQEIKIKFYGQKSTGAKNCHKNQTSFKTNQYSLLSEQKQSLLYSTKRKIGIHSYIQSKYQSKYKQNLISKDPKVGFVCYTIRYWQQCNYLLFIQAYIHSTKKYYFFQLQIENIINLLSYSINKKSKFIQRMITNKIYLLKIIKLGLNISSKEYNILEIVFMNKKLNIIGNQILCLNYYGKGSVLTQIQIIYPIQLQSKLKKRQFQHQSKMHKIARKIIHCNNQKLDNVYYQQQDFKKLIQISHQKNFDYGSIIYRAKKYAQQVKNKLKRHTQLNKSYNYYYGSEFNIYKLFLSQGVQKLQIFSLYGQKYFELKQNMIPDTFKCFKILKGKAKFRYLKRVLKDYQ